MRVLVTGGAGCLGANIVERLLARGDDVLTLDNYATSARDALPDASGQLEVVEGSVVDRALVRRVFDGFGPEVVIHSAASYKDPDDWSGDLETNAQGTLNVVEAAREAGAGRLVNFQTALCYGRPDETPIPVEAPVRPFTSYGVSKTAGEHIVLASGLNAVSLRLANVTGPRLSIGPIPAFYTRLKAGKDCFCSDTVRDFLDMEDFFALLDKAMSPDAAQGVFNVSTGRGHSILDVYRAVASALGMDVADAPVVPPGADDVAAVVLDPSRTEAAFDWRAQVSFEESIARMVAWYDEHGVRAIYSHLRAPGKSGT